MPARKRTKIDAGERLELERNRVGDLFAEVPGEGGESKVRFSFRRSWYSPPLTDKGKVDFELAAQELSSELSGGTLVVQRYLENGDLGYATEIPVASEAELELILSTLHQLYFESLRHDNAVRRAGLDACKAAISQAEQAELAEERRQERERRLLRRRGRQLLGRAWFWNSDRRAEADRRIGVDRRSRQGRISTPH